MTILIKPILSFHEFILFAHKGEKTRLVSMEEEHAGKKPLFLDDVAIASDGSIFFTDASSIGTLDTLIFEVTSSGSGRYSNDILPC